MTSAIPIKRLASVTLGKMVQPDSKAESDIYAPYLRAAHVQPHGNVIELPDQRMWFSRPELLALDLRQGDVVVVEGGAGYGRSAVLREDLPGWGFQNSIVRLRPAVGVADGRYLDYALQDALADGRIDLVTSTATLPHFTADKVSKFEVPSPALDEQRAIADYLDHETAQIDALVAKQEEFIGLLRERRSAVILSVAGTISAKETRPLRRLAILSTGSTPSGGSGEDNFVGEREIGWVTPEDLRAAIVPTRFPTATALKQMTVVPAGSTLVCGIGASVGKLGFSVSSVTTNQQITSAVPREGVHGRYLYYAIAAEREQLFANTVTTTLPIINNVRLGSLIIKSCSFAEQNRIADHLDEQTSRIDTLIAKAEEHIALAKERRSALITAAVTGQLNVRTARKAG